MGEVSRRWACLWTVMTCALAFSLCASPGLADEAGEPERQRIGVFGDSLADGLWVGLQRGLRRDERAGEILQQSEVSTGLTNYVYRDIGEKTRDQLSRNRFDTAVVLFGSNDIQGIRTDRGVFRFRSPAWEDVYRARIRDIVTQLQTHGADVYWVGLPVMRASSYNANTVYLNSLFRDEVEALGAVFVSTRDVTGDENGQYAPYLPDANGAPRLIRDDDGIHFTLTGYTRMAAPVADAIRRGWDQPRIESTPAVMTAEAEPARPDGWLDLLVNGEAYLCQPVLPSIELGGGDAATAND